MSQCGKTRREMIWESGAGFAGTALTYLLAGTGFFNAKAAAATAGKKPHFAPKAKACIFLFMYGGPSHMDTFDPKPELVKRHGQQMPNMGTDALLKLRAARLGALLGSRRKFTRYGQSGIEVSDFYPHVGKCIDDIAVIRSMWTDSFAHGSGLLQMNTGFIRQGFPSIGSWLNYGLGTENENLPGYVVMLDHRGGPISGPPNWGSGYMPASFQGTQFRSSGDPILNMEPPAGVTVEQQRRQLDLLAELGRGPAVPGAPENDELNARIASFELAFRMQSTAPEAVDLSKENEETKRLYGLDNPVTAPYGRNCLIGRRLVERGVRFVQLYSGGGHGDANWDAHRDVDENHAEHCAETDQPIAALLTDLKRRGLLDETLVIWGGEFGRMPMSDTTRVGTKGGGRDHNPKGFSMWMAGGGVKGGQVVGATDEFGYAAMDNRIHVHDLHATILHLMGLDHTLLTYFHGGRNMRLTDVHGHVVKQLLA
ncbi:MAG: DUF1501 domain-containing protein [Acidobacteria bacterium]|nr:DUF1501 domain-containing protein [Acidobacteriota bacterium]